MSANNLVDLNSANAAQLMSLPGIGPGLAARIIAHRTEHSINTAAQLAAIPGISERMAAELHPLVLLENVTVASESAAEAAEFTDEPEEANSPEPIVEVTEAAESKHEEVSELEEALAAATDWRNAAFDAVGHGSDDEREETGDDNSDEEPADITAETEAQDEVDASLPEAEALPLFADSDDDLPTLEPEAEPEVESEAEPMFTAPPEPTPAPTYNVANEASSLLKLTGCRGTTLALFGGAIFGTLLTLVLLFVFNGGLRFADLDQVNNLADEQDVLQDELRSLEDELVTAEAAQADFEANLDEAAAEQGNLQATVAFMETRIENGGQAAERLDTFIVGMRDFLNELATPSAPTMTPFVTPTDTVEDALTATPVPAAGSTRTPRPTSTPIVTATP